MVFQIAYTELKNLLRSTKIIVLGVFLLFLHMQIVLPLRECSELMGKKLSWFEPFIAASNSGMVVLILPLFFLVMIADFPNEGGISPFFHVRCKKRTWVLGQILFAVFASLFVTGFVLVSSMVLLVPKGAWFSGFSDAVTKYVSVFPERAGDYITQLLPENVYHQMTLKTAVVYSVSLLFCYFLLLALVVLFFTMLNHKLAGLLIDGALILTGTVACGFRLEGMWAFPMTHTISWLHYTEYFSEPVFPIWGSYLYFSVLIVILAAGSLIAGKRYEII